MNFGGVGFDGCWLLVTAKNVGSVRIVQGDQVPYVDYSACATK